MFLVDLLYLKQTIGDNKCGLYRISQVLIYLANIDTYIYLLSFNILSSNFGDALHENVRLDLTFKYALVSLLSIKTEPFKPAGVYITVTEHMSEQFDNRELGVTECFSRSYHATKL